MTTKIVYGWWIDELYDRAKKEGSPIALFNTPEHLFKALSCHERSAPEDTLIGVVWGYHVTMFGDWTVER